MRNLNAKFASLMLVLMLMISLLPAAALAADTWDGSIAAAFAGGEGTESNPYQIATGAQLAYLSSQVAAGTTYDNQYFILTSDINLNNQPWQPIGNSTTPFMGFFDGNEMTISNLHVVKGLENTSANNYIGLFGYMQGSSNAGIQDLTVHNAQVKGSLYVGVVVGRTYTSGPFTNIRVTGDIQVDAWWYASALIGRHEYSGDITNCHVDANAGSYVKGNDGSYIAGIAGFRSEDSCAIKNCSVNNLAISGVDRVGGIAGIAHYGNTIGNCTVSNISVSASSPYAASVGIIAGANNGTDTNVATVINNTYSSNVTASVAGTPVTTPVGAGQHNNAAPNANGSLVGNDVVIDESTGKVVSGTFQNIPQDMIPSDTLSVSTSTNPGMTSYGTEAEKVLENAKPGEEITITSTGSDANLDVPEGVVINNKTGSDITVNNGTITDGGHVHSMTHHVARPSTCSVAGTLEYWTCPGADCAGKYYGDDNGNTTLDSITAPLASHTLYSVPAQPRTCLQNGNIAYVKCQNCPKLFADTTTAVELSQQDVTLPAIGSHNYDPVTRLCTNVNDGVVCNAPFCEHAVKNHYAETPATCRETGLKEHYECQNPKCGQWFDKDGNKTTQQAMTLNLLPHSDTNPIDGLCDNLMMKDGQPVRCGELVSNAGHIGSGDVVFSYVNGSTFNGRDALTFKSNLDIRTFRCVKVNGEVVDPMFYTAESGSIKITLKKVYLDSLKPGAYKLEIVSQLGNDLVSATGAFNIPYPASSLPKTGDSSQLLLWAVLMLAAGSGSLLLMLRMRKRGN